MFKTALGSLFRVDVGGFRIIGDLSALELDFIDPLASFVVSCRNCYGLVSSAYVWTIGLLCYYGNSP